MVSFEIFGEEVLLYWFFYCNFVYWVNFNEVYVILFWFDRLYGEWLLILFFVFIEELYESREDGVVEIYL